MSDNAKASYYGNMDVKGIKIELKSVCIERAENGFIAMIGSRRFVSMDWSMLSAALDRYFREGDLEGFGIARDDMFKKRLEGSTLGERQEG